MDTLCVTFSSGGMNYRTTAASTSRHLNLTSPMTSANQKPQCGGHEIPAAVSELHSDWIRLAWSAFGSSCDSISLIQEAKIYNLIQDPDTFNYSNRNEDRIGRFYEGENVDNVTVLALTSQG